MAMHRSTTSHRDQALLASTLAALHFMTRQITASHEFAFVTRGTLDLVNQSPRFRGQVNSALLWSYVMALSSLHQDMLQKDVSERYQQLRRRRGLAGRLTQRETASYLNIAEPSLSRIIKRMEEDRPGRSPGASSGNPAPAEPLSDDDAPRSGHPHPDRGG